MVSSRRVVGSARSRAALATLGAAAGIAIGSTLLGYGPFPVAALVAFLLLVLWAMRALAGERDRLAATLTRSERLFAHLSAASPAGIVHFDALGRPTHANSRWSVLTGIDDVVACEERWLEAIAPTDRSAVSSLWARARATLEACKGDYAFLANGEAGGDAEIAIYPAVEAGKVLGFAVLLTDVTARRRDRMAQLERESRYRLISEHAQDVILRLAPDGRVRSASDASLRVTGYAPAEVVGRALADFVHPDDVPLIDASLARATEFVPDPSIEFRLRHRDGHYNWFESSQRVLFDRNGDPFELIASLRDVGRRRRAEGAAAAAAATRDETLRLLALVEQAAGVGHWRFDPARRLLETSAKVHCILGQRRDTRLRPMTVLGRVDRDDRRAVLACLSRARHAAGPAECAVRLTARDVTRHVRLVAQADHRDGIFAGWSGMLEELGSHAPAALALVARGVAERPSPAASPSPVTMAAAAPARAPHHGGRRGLNILVAEDDPADQRLVAAIVRRMGHEVTIVETGREAVAAATRTPYDAILMDMQMPKMDGLAATRAIRASAGRCAETVIIALTDDASPERKRFTVGAGFSHVLSKPIDRALLATHLDAIAAALGPPADEAPASLVEAARIEELRRVLGSERLEALLGLLIVECLDRPAHIRTAFCRGELAAIRAEGHGLKGAALSIGATALGQVAEQLEAVTSVALAEPLISALEECAESTRTAVLRLLGAATDGRVSA